MAGGTRPGTPSRWDFIGRRRQYISDLAWYGMAFTVSGVGAQTQATGSMERSALATLGLIGLAMVAWAVRRKLRDSHTDQRWF